MPEFSTLPSPRQNRWVTFGLWLVVLAPLLMGMRLVYLYSVDQRFLDDWVWASDLVKWKQGHYGELFHDLCSVHLEHRPIVPRTLALIVTLLMHGNVQGQNVLSFLWVTITFAALCVLWMRLGGMTLRYGWLPLFLASALLYTPIQWQAFLWPICHETTMPVMFFLLSLLAAFKPWRWWVRCLTGTLYAILAMLSFASGFLIWVLPLPVFLFAGKFSGTREKIRFVIMWAAVFCVAMLVYLKVSVQKHDSITVEKTLIALPGGHDLTYDLHNEVPAQYAYGHSEENTMNGELEYFLGHPGLDAEFVATFTGAVLARGWSADLKVAGQNVGWVLLLGWLGAAVYFWRNRNDVHLRASLLPMLCLGAYTPATALMVAVGRIGAGGTGTALNGRYSVHQVPLVIALVGAAVFISRHRREKLALPAPDPLRPSVGWAAAGVLAGVVGVGWIHGAAIMWEWNAARWRGAAAQYLSQVFERSNVFVSFIAGNHKIAHDSAAALNDCGLLRRGLAQNLDLSNFAVASKSPELEDDQGEFQRLWKNEAGEWRIQGYARLPGINRPADAVLLAYRDAEGKWVMFGFTQPWGVAYYLSRSLGKDEYAIIPGRDPWPQRILCPFFPEVYIEKDPPPEAQITAWALDMKLRLIHRIPHWRDLPDAKGKIVNTPDGRDGSTLKELARDDIDP